MHFLSIFYPINSLSLCILGQIYLIIKPHHIIYWVLKIYCYMVFPLYINQYSWLDRELLLMFMSVMTPAPMVMDCTFFIRTHPNLFTYNPCIWTVYVTSVFSLHVPSPALHILHFLHCSIFSICWVLNSDLCCCCPHLLHKDLLERFSFTGLETDTSTDGLKVDQEPIPIKPFSPSSTIYVMPWNCEW